MEFIVINFLESDLDNCDNIIKNLNKNNTELFLKSLLDIDPTNYKSIDKKIKHLIKTKNIDTNLDNETLCEIVDKHQNYLDTYLYILNESFPRFNINKLENIQNIKFVKAALDCGLTNFEVCNCRSIISTLPLQYLKKVVKIMPSQVIIECIFEFIKELCRFIQVDTNILIHNKILFIGEKIIICTDEIVSKNDIKKICYKRRFHIVLCCYLKICKKFYNKIDDIPYGNDINDIIIDEISNLEMNNLTNLSLN